MGMTLRLEDRGSSVKELQTALNGAGYNLAVDGYFGSQTLGAVKDYQTKLGLDADGIVGNDLWGRLNGVVPGATPEATPEATPGSSSTTIPEPVYKPLPEFTPGANSGASTGATSDALLQLMNKFNETSGYAPKTAEQIREQASGEYQSYYDTMRQNAQQQYDRSDLALQQQKEGLGASYDRLREDSDRQYAKAYSAADHAMLGRGMQRSSYGAQTLSNISLEGARARQDISDAQIAAEGNIDAQRAQLAQQLADDLNQFSANEQADIMARVRELEDQEYERTQTATSRQDAIALQIYQLLYQEGRDKVADEQWNQQLAYQQHRDQVADTQRDNQLIYQQYRDQIADAQWNQQFEFSKKQYDDSQAKSSGGSSGGYSGGATSSSAPSTGQSGVTNPYGDPGAFMAGLDAGLGNKTKPRLPSTSANANPLTGSTQNQNLLGTPGKKKPVAAVTLK